MESEKRGWYDLHSHILPGMDDGARTCQESAEMLRRSGEQGVLGMAATPHYYPKEPVTQFLERRAASYQRLREYLEENGLTSPELCLGAEVAYHTGLVYEEQLEQLCLGQSRYLLLELPFARWSPNVLRDVRAFRSMWGIVPVIAHLERYQKLQERRTMEELLDCGVLIQVNAEFLLGFWSRRKAKKLIQRDLVQVLGSDCHNLTSRPPNLGQAVQQLASSPDCVEKVWRWNHTIFHAAVSGSEVIG